MVARWPLVGRADELEEISRLLSSDGGPRGAALFGEAGVGKTRLLTDAVADLAGRGIPVEWVRATEAARDIPLGSFAHVLAAGDDARVPDDLLHTALSRLGDRAGGGRFVLAIDDAHQLDQISVALVHMAVTQADIRVLMTVRTGGRLPRGLVSLWTDELIQRSATRPLA